MSNKRVVYIDMLKIFACLQVIFLHVFIKVVGNSMIDKFLIFLVRDIYCGVNIFFMVMGYTQLRKGRFEGCENIYKKVFIRIAKVILALIVFQFPYYIFLKVSGRLEYGLVSYVFKQIKFQGIEPATWFLKPFSAFVLMTPILYCIVNGLSKNDFILMLFFIFFNERFAILKEWMPYALDNNMIRFGGYVVLAFIGYFIHYHIKNSLVYTCILMIFYIFANYVGLSNLSWIRTAFFVLLFKTLNDFGLFVKYDMIICKISELTFGVYMVHMYVYNLFRNIFRFVYNYSEIIDAKIALLLSFMTFTASLTIIYFLKKIKLLKDIL